MTHVLQSIMPSYTKYWRLMSTSKINGHFMFYLCCGSSLFESSGGFRGGSRGSLEPPSGPKLFHFHGKFQETFREIRQTNPPFLHLNPHFLNPGSAPGIVVLFALFMYVFVYFVKPNN